MAEKIKVLIVHHTANLDGSSISLLNLLKGLDKEEVRLTILLANDGPLKGLIRSMGIDVLTLPINLFYTFPGPTWSERSFFYNFKAFLPDKQITQCLQALKPDIVHLNDKALIAVGMAAKKLNIPIVWHSRSTYHITRVKLNSLISSRAIKHCADHIIAISEDEIDKLEAFKKLTIIYNSVDFTDVLNATEHREETRQNLNLANDELAIGLIGHVSEKRGAWDFIQAAGMIKKQHPDRPMKFFLVGKVPQVTSYGIRDKLNLTEKIDYLQTAQQLICQANIADDITITGFRSDVLCVMAALDIIVVYSRLGVLGRPPFEAMALGKPVIVAAGHSDKSKIVINEVTGLVIPPANPVELAKALNRLIENPQLRENLARKGSVYAKENFDPKIQSELVRKIYREVLDARAQ